jgi:hypothetical protein
MDVAQFREVVVMKTLTPEEMRQISGGTLMPQQSFPDLVARLIVSLLFFDFGADRRRGQPMPS